MEGHGRCWSVLEEQLKLASVYTCMECEIRAATLPSRWHEFTHCLRRWASGPNCRKWKWPQLHAATPSAAAIEGGDVRKRQLTSERVRSKEHRKMCL